MKFNPKLRASRTISHPSDPARVIGFQGRDVGLGREAVIFKAEELPSTDLRVGLNAEEIHGIVYILGEDTVYVEESPGDRAVHTFTEGPDGITTCPSLKWEDLETYDLEDVEVST